MKPNSILAAGLLAAVAVLSLSPAQAASEAEAAAQAKIRDAGIQADRKTKPDSPATERNDRPQTPPGTAVEGISSGTKPDPNRNRHLHPRDGKS